MITINGLTERQKNLMDLLWGCRDLAQVNTLISALPSRADQYDALSLITVATLESIEQELGLDDYADAAQAAIDRARC